MFCAAHASRGWGRACHTLSVRVPDRLLFAFLLVLLVGSAGLIVVALVGLL